MAKIRGFKPGLWTDDDFVDLTPWARLLWLGMWTFACDNGHLPDKPKQIKMQVLPADDVNCADLLRELAAKGRITRDDGWITIPNLTFHQKPDRRYFTACTKDGCEVPPETVSQRKSRRVHGVHTPGARGVHATEGEGEGEGEVMVKERTTLSDKSDDADPDIIDGIEVHPTPDRFDEFWATYDKKSGRKPAQAKYRLALKKPGVTPDLLITAAAAYIDWQKREGKHPEFTANATTWLNQERWNDERAARSKPQSRADGWLAAAERLHDDRLNLTEGHA